MHEHGFAERVVVACIEVFKEGIELALAGVPSGQMAVRIKTNLPIISAPPG
jgi:hypothetical protein